MIENIEVNTPESVATPKPNLGGPSSPEGRAISSKNATKHGCTANTLILEHESVEDYKALAETWFKVYQPKDKLECTLLEQVVNANWYYRRAEAALAQIEATFLEENPNPADWTEAQDRKILRHQRYKTAQMNLMNKAKKQLDDHRRIEQIENNRNTRLKIAVDRHKAQKKRQEEAEMPLDQVLERMRRKATELGFRDENGNPTGKKG